MKISKILIFLVAIFCTFLVIMAVFPKDGIAITDTIKLKAPNLKEFFSFSPKSEYVDIDGIITHVQDTSILKELNTMSDSLEAYKKISAENPSKLEYANGDKRVLHGLFKALEQVEDNNESIRILHYGDSQIEMDRITNYVREELQTRFGGMGPGLQPPLQVIPSMSVRQSTSGNFRRFASWGSNDMRANHNRYGIMLNLTEFDGSGSVSFSPANLAYDLSKNYNTVRLLAENNDALSLSIAYNGKGGIRPTQITPKGKAKLYEWTLDSLTSKITITFNASRKTEIYSIGLDGNKGIAVDNMPMRGCSGTIFTRSDSALFADSYDLMKVKLIIFQFGGNMMPSVSGEKSATSYGERFFGNLQYIKNTRPDISIVVIGPSDMSKRINGEWQTYPHLELVRDALKKATFDIGGAYWDMYEIMGGKNSMPTWKEKGLAGADYIHFTNKGAQKVSEMFFDAILNDYNEYRFQSKIDSLEAKKTIK